MRQTPLNLEEGPELVDFLLFFSAGTEMDSSIVSEDIDPELSKENEVRLRPWVVVEGDSTFDIETRNSPSVVLSLEFLSRTNVFVSFSA